MKAEAVICGAGIAGIAAAYHLSVQRGIDDVLIVDELPPLSLTSDKSTECYRNWWPGPGDAMVALTNRSIDILEALARESGNRFLLSRRGYLFATADAERAGRMRADALQSCALGAGEFREHSPGWVLLGYVLQWATENGIEEFDFMRGDEEYKYRFGAVDRYVMRMQIQR